MDRGERAFGGADALAWKPSIESTALSSAGYPPNIGQRTVVAPQDKVRTNKLEGKPGLSPRRGLPTVNEVKSGHPRPRPSDGAIQDLSECLRLQYAAILSIAQAVRAAPPPADAMLAGRSDEDAVTAAPSAPVNPEQLLVRAKEVEAQMEAAAAQKDFALAAKLQQDLKAAHERLQQEQQRQAAERQRAVQYAAILSIAQAVRARPPPSDALLPGRPGEDATTTALRVEVAHMRETVTRQTAQLAQQQQEIAQLRAAMKSISEAQQRAPAAPAQQRR